MNKFDKGPVSKKEMSRKEAGIKLAQETWIEVNQKLFTLLERSNPDMAEKLRADFDEFIEVFISMNAEDPSGTKVTLSTVEQKIPNNKWIKLMRSIKPQPRSEELMRSASKEWNTNLDKKIKGKDIQ